MDSSTGSWLTRDESLHSATGFRFEILEVSSPPQASVSPSADGEILRWGSSSLGALRFCGDVAVIWGSWSRTPAEQLIQLRRSSSPARLPVSSLYLLRWEIFPSFHGLKPHWTNLLGLWMRLKASEKKENLCPICAWTKLTCRLASLNPKSSPFSP